MPSPQELRQYTDIEFINEAERVYFEEVQLGERVRSFLNTPLGRYLHGRAKLEYDEAKEELLEIDAYTKEGKILYNQTRIKAKVAGSFMRWLADAINNAETAMTQIEQIDVEER